MTHTATVNYHVHKPEQQAFYLDAGGIKGNLVSPELQSIEIQLADASAVQGNVTFATDAVMFAQFPAETAINDNTEWQKPYDTELTRFLQNHIGAKEVIVFDHTIRVDDPDAVRPPARNVHSDYSKEGAQQRLVDILGAEQAEIWKAGHYSFVNIWRPLENPINSAPLGFIRPQSVNDKDWVLLDLVYPDRKGQILGVVHNPDHKWVYKRGMTPDEVAVFNIYDNQGLPSVAHSALDKVEDPDVKTVRKSIESRTLVLY